MASCSLGSLFRRPGLRAWQAVVGVSVALAVCDAVANAQSQAPDSSARAPLRRIRPPWIAPDSSERSQARRTTLGAAGGISVRDGITLTPAQDAAMAAAREQYRPRLRTLAARLQAVSSQPHTADKAALTDSLRRTIIAQRTAVLAVLTPAQRHRYEENAARVHAVQTSQQPPSN